MHPHHENFVGWEAIPQGAIARIIASARAQQALVELFFEDASSNMYFLKDATPNILLDVGAGHSRIPQKGTIVTVRWRRAEDGYHYGFQTMSDGVIRHSDGHDAVTLAFPKVLLRTQRRSAYRVPVDLDTAQSLTVQWDDHVDYKSTAAFAHDLSITGAQLSFSTYLECPVAIEIGQRLEITVNLQGEHYGSTAQVVRMEKVGTPDDHSVGRERVLLGVQFIDPSQPFQNALEAYVSRQQQLLLRR
ncbi:flagellar brake protein [Acidithiobacillus ferriphilus]|uniref:flagellar brake protein n=1 Tax=Acidithiobacillus ferriphilus TaxID=1689834 RepID=UPI001C06B859|nr:PilZ domain-containing protein [Acidithiobacillus ferriphilus]MBU2829290.1 PilZ domain-containing protein [Acidithiobacillus ferriphilus]